MPLNLSRKVLPLVLIVSSTLAVPARADDLEVECSTPKQCFSIGTEKYEAGRLNEAAEYFTRSWGLSQTQEAQDIYARGLLLYNIGVVYETGGEPEKAIPYFQLYLEEIGRVERSRRQIPKKRDEEIPGKRETEVRLAFLRKYAEGNRLLRDGKYNEAIALYAEVSMALERLKPVLSKEIGRAHEMSGNYPEAIASYKLYLGGSHNAHDRVEIESRIESMEELLRMPALVPLVPLVEPKPLKPKPPVSKTPPQKEKPFFIRHIASISAGTVAAGLGIAGLVFNEMADNRYDELARTCGSTGRGCSEGSIQEVKDLRTKRNVLYGSTAVMGATAIGFLIWEIYKNQKPNKTNPPVSIKPHGVEVKF